jgi:hypothetical protein
MSVSQGINLYLRGLTAAIDGRTGRRRRVLAGRSGLAGDEVLGEASAGKLSPSNRETSSSVLRGRWFTTMCWVCLAALRLITPIAPNGSPWICVV